MNIERHEKHEKKLFVFSCFSMLIIVSMLTVFLDFDS